MHIFDGAVVYISDIHCEQAWIRWVHERKHGLSGSDTDTELLEMLRNCAWAPSDDNATDYHYQQAVKKLHSSSVWKNNLGM